jgi:Ca2+-binding EF-hand superfamily protein
MKTALISGVFAATTLGAAASADHHGLAFDEVDADGNGQVSFTELSDAVDEADRSVFDEHDENADGALNETEFDAWKQARMSEEDDDGGYDC